MSSRRYKYPCHYSRTGWAWAASEDRLRALPMGCTCKPCAPPRSEAEVHPTQRQFWPAFIAACEAAR